MAKSLYKKTTPDPHFHIPKFDSEGWPNPNCTEYHDIGWGWLDPTLTDEPPHYWYTPFGEFRRLANGTTQRISGISWGPEGVTLGPDVQDYQREVA